MRAGILTGLALTAGGGVSPQDTEHPTDALTAGTQVPLEFLLNLEEKLFLESWTK